MATEIVKNNNNNVQFKLGEKEKKRERDRLSHQGWGAVTMGRCASPPEKKTSPPSLPNRRQRSIFILYSREKRR